MLGLDVLIIIVVTSFVQSLFGVGVLLFGTPLVMLTGREFVEAISVLLPISLSINILQIAAHHRQADWRFFRKVLVYTIPFVVAFLALAMTSGIDIGLFVGLFLLLVAAKDLSPRLGAAVRRLVRYERPYLVVMGLVHGLTNLGGSMLTAIVHGRDYGKEATRTTVALCYATFAVFQLGTLLAAGRSSDVVNVASGMYLLAGLIVFVLTETLLYAEIASARYRGFFAAFLAASGALLCVRAI